MASSLTTRLRTRGQLKRRNQEQTTCFLKCRTLMEIIFLKLRGSRVEFYFVPLPGLTPFSGVSYSYSHLHIWNLHQTLEVRQPNPFISLLSKKGSVSWWVKHCFRCLSLNCHSFQKAFPDTSDRLDSLYIILLPPSFSFMTLVIIYLISTFPQNTVSSLGVETVFVTALGLPRGRNS